MSNTTNSLSSGPAGMEAGKLPSFSDMIKTYKYKGVSISVMTTPDIMEEIHNVEVREDDTILATFPKCGTHWMMEILSLIRNNGVPLTSIQRREHGLLELPLPQPEFALGFRALKDKPSPRIYVTHLPIQFLPKQIWEEKPKIIYVCRNPKDMLASMHNFVAGNPGVPSWNETFEQFISDDMPYGPFSGHVLGYWKHREDDNILFVRFEDMKKDIPGWVAKIAKHIDHPLTPEAVDSVVKYSSVKEMKASYAKAEEELEEGKFITRAMGMLPFINKGKVGGWKTLFTVAQSELLEEKIKEELKGSGLDFQFNL